MLQNSLLVLLLIFTFTLQAAEPVADTYPVPQDKVIKPITGKKGSKLILSSNGNPATLNPFLFTDTETRKILGECTYLPLVVYNRITHEFDHALSKSHTVSADGKTYTFDLRQGLHWSDGTPFSMKDVELSFQIAFDQNISFAGRDILIQGDGSFPKVLALNDHQIQFQLSEKNAMFLAGLYEVFIVPYHKWHKVYTDGQFGQAMTTQADPATMPTMGPYFIEKFVPDQRIVLARNPYYFKFDSEGKRLPYYDKVIRIIVPDFNSEFIKFSNQETQMHELRPENYDLAIAKQQEANFTVTDLGPSYVRYYLSFNMNPHMSKDGKPFVEAKKLKLFSDKRFRQAISYAIDRKSIVSNVFHGRATAFSTMMSPGNTAWYNSNAKAYPYNLEQAKKLLTEIGLKDTNGDGILEFADGTNIQFTMNTNSENHSRVQIGAMLVDDFKKIGLVANVQPIPFNALLTKVNDYHDFDAIILGWGGGVPPDPTNAKNVFMSSGHGHNWNPEQVKPETEWEKKIDELILAMQVELDPVKRKALYDQVEMIWTDELPQIMMVSQNMSIGVANNIGNAHPVIDEPYFDWNVDELFDKNL